MDAQPEFAPPQRSQNYNSFEPEEYIPQVDPPLIDSYSRQSNPYQPQQDSMWAHPGTTNQVMAMAPQVTLSETHRLYEEFLTGRRVLRNIVLQPERNPKSARTYRAPMARANSIQEAPTNVVADCAEKVINSLATMSEEPAKPVLPEKWANLSKEDLGASPRGAYAAALSGSGATPRARDDKEPVSSEDTADVVKAITPEKLEKVAPKPQEDEWQTKEAKKKPPKKRVETPEGRVYDRRTVLDMRNWVHSAYPEKPSELEGMSTSTREVPVLQGKGGYGSGRPHFGSARGSQAQAPQDWSRGTMSFQFETPPKKSITPLDVGEEGYQFKRSSNRREVEETTPLSPRSMAVRERKEATETITRLATNYLNKITSSNFDNIVNSVINIELKRADDLKTLVEVIYTKAIDEKHYLEVYTRCCEALFHKYKTMELQCSDSDEQVADDDETESKSKTPEKPPKKGKKSKKAPEDDGKSEKDGKDGEGTGKKPKSKNLADKAFKSALITKCQECSQQTKPTAEYENFEPEEIVEMELRRKKRMIGNIRFMGELYNRSIVNIKIFRQVGTDLTDAFGLEGDNVRLECFLNLLQTTHKALREQDFNLYTQYVQVLHEAHRAPTTEKRLTYLIQNFLDEIKSVVPPMRMNPNAHHQNSTPLGKSTKSARNK